MSDLLKLPAHPTPGDVFRALATWYDENPDCPLPDIDLNQHTSGRMSENEATLFVAALAAKYPTDSIRGNNKTSIWTYVRFDQTTRLCVFTSGHLDCPPACPHPVHEVDRFGQP